MSDADRIFKDSIYEQIARVGRAVAHPRRLELLDLLCQAPMTVEQLAQKSALPIGSASQHLQHLKAARLVIADRQGTYMRYRLKDDLSCSLLHTLKTVAEQYYAEMRVITEDFLMDHQNLQAVSITDIQTRGADDSLTLVDVRPVEEYKAGHWPGAISIPLEALADRLMELPVDHTIVAYCRGPYCLLSLHAVKTLQREGFHAVRLIEGVSDWRVRGLPIVLGDAPLK